MSNGDGEGKTIRIDLNALKHVGQKQERRPSLIVLTGASFGEFFPLHSERTRIGRSLQCDIRIEDGSISRQHAEVIKRGEEVWLRDLKSANGTFLNGNPIGQSPIRVNEGDKITLGKMTILRFSFNDSFDEAFQRRLYDAALRDGLTRAYNKRYLLERLDIELSFARRHHSPLSLIIFDVDHFKLVNDNHGHPVGDQVLIELVQRVQTLVRQEDIFGRYGGEEFVIVCRGNTLSEGLIVGERVRQVTAEAPFVFGRLSLPISVSVGVSAFPNVQVSTAGELISVADKALYQAKRGGRNRVVSFTSLEGEY